MANPNPDYPTSTHTALDTSAYTSEKLGLSTVKHTDVHGKVEETLTKITEKLGIGESDASAATDGQLMTKQADGTTAWEDPPSSGVTDHGALTGLSDDDHTQYHTDARGDIRYVNHGSDGEGTEDLDYVAFNALYTEDGSEAVGSVFWNQDEETLNVKVNSNVTLQVGQELFFNVKNQTGSAITNGTPVMFAGTLGASGRLLIQPAIADGSLASSYIMGVATEDIANGADGKVTWFGKVRGIDTTGTSYSESWNDGDILYVSTTTAGYLTNVKPTVPNQIIEVAAVVYSDVNNGELVVRPTWNGHENFTGTKATILATSPIYKAIAFSTDTKELMLYDGSVWREAPLSLKPSATGISMGAYNDTNGTYDGLGDSDEQGFNDGSIFGKLLTNSVISNSVIGDNTERIEEGAIRVNNSTYQIYLNSQWNDIVINFRFREDDSGAYELEHKPVGFNEWIEVNSGNSNLTGMNGLPLTQQYVSSMGVYPERMLISGRS